MKHSIKNLAIVLTTLLLSACATQEITISSEIAKRLNRVGIVSVTANTFTRQHVGFTVFGNEFEQKQLTDWDMNSQYESQLAKAVESVLGAKAVRATYAAADFSRVNELNGPWNAPAFWGPNWTAIEGATRTFCAANDLDAVVVAGRFKTSDIFGGSNQSVEGLGIYSGRGGDLLHLLTVLGLIDCKTAKPLASRLVFRSRPGAEEKARKFFPAIELPSEVTRMKMSEWTPGTEEKLKQLVVSLPGPAWAETLKLIAPQGR